MSDNLSGKASSKFACANSKMIAIAINPKYGLMYFNNLIEAIQIRSPEVSLFLNLYYSSLKMKINFFFSIAITIVDGKTEEIEEYFSFRVIMISVRAEEI
jgi:hypothetical protein